MHLISYTWHPLRYYNSALPLNLFTVWISLNHATVPQTVGFWVPHGFDCYCPAQCSVNFQHYYIDPWGSWPHMDIMFSLKKNCIKFLTRALKCNFKKKKLCNGRALCRLQSISITDCILGILSQRPQSHSFSPSYSLFLWRQKVLTGYYKFIGNVSKNRQTFRNKL